METRYIKVDYEKALLSKEQALSLELSLLQTEKNIKNYKILRKKELALKNKLKIFLKSIKTKINSLQSLFPEKEQPLVPKKRKKSIEKKERQDIKKQLEEIQEKLAKLQ